MTGKSGERSGLDREDTEDKEDTEGDTDLSICFLEGEEGVEGEEGGDGKKGEEGGDKESEASLSPYITHDVNIQSLNIHLALHSRTVRRPGLQNSLEEVCVGGQLWLHLVLDLPPGEDVVQHDADYPTGLAESKVKMSLVSHDLTSFI